MDKFGMYKKVVQSCASKPAGNRPPEDKPRPPSDAAQTAQPQAAQAYGENAKPGPAAAPLKSDGGSAPDSRKPPSHALRVFLESQARHDRLSREIDIRNGLADK